MKETRIQGHSREKRRSRNQKQPSHIGGGDITRRPRRHRGRPPKFCQSRQAKPRRENLTQLNPKQHK